MHINIFDTVSIVEYSLMGLEKLGQEITKRTVELNEMKRTITKYDLTTWGKVDRLQKEIETLSVIYSYVSTYEP